MTNVAAGNQGASAQPLFTPAGWRGEGQPPLYTAAQIAALVEAQQPAACGNTPYDEGPFTLAQQPAPSAAAMGDVDLPDAEDMAHSAVQEALSFGLSHDVIHRWMRHIQDQTVKAMLAAPQPSTTPQADSAPASVAGPMQFGGCPECGSRSCVARECSRTVSHAAQALPGVQWQCGPQANGFTAPQADSQPAPVRDESAAPKLRAMAINYPEGACWDKLDAQTCMEGALEIEALRAARAPADSAPAWASQAVIEYRYTGGTHWCPLGPAERMKPNFDGVYRLQGGVFPVEAPADSVTAPAGGGAPTGRTDAEIVQQTEELATFLLGWAFNHEPGPDAPAMRDSTHPFALRAWSAACHIQDMLTQTDVQNALAELEDTPESGQLTTPPAQSAPSVLEDAARLWEAFIEAWRNEIGVDKIVNIMGGADKLKAVFLDAARKQGGAT